MPNLIKFMLLAIPVLGFGMFMGYQDYMIPVEFSAQGKVTSIEWKSSNHGMPIIEISRDNNVINIFSSNRITLNSTQIKVGDSFSKVGGSKACQINKRTLQCVN